MAPSWAALGTEADWSDSSSALSALWAALDFSRVASRFFARSGWALSPDGAALAGAGLLVRPRRDQPMTPARAAMKAGFQMGIHAIGDAGNREVLDFLEAC